MTAEWLHLPHPYPPGVGPLCGAELEAWYEDLQDILGSDAGGAKLARATAAPPPPSCSEKEPEFLDVLESCSLTWLTEGGHAWGEAGVQRVTDEGPATQPPHHHHHHHHHASSSSPHPSSSPSPSSSCLSPAVEEGDVAREPSGGGDLLPPEFFELLSEGGVGMVETGGVALGSGYHHHQHHHHHDPQPGSPSPSEEEEEEEPPRVPASPSCSSSSSSSHSPSRHCSPPSSPVPSPTLYSPARLGKRKRSDTPPFPSSGSHSSSASAAKKSRKEREQENERKVQELTDQNERLKAEIERLGEEVQKTRRALIERLVNTRK